MNSTMTALGAVMACAALAAAPAAAQSTYTPPATQQAPNLDQYQREDPRAQQKEEAPVENSGPQPRVSRQALKAIQDLQATVKAKNYAEIPAKVAAAEAAAQIADDRYMIGVLRYEAAVAAKDDSARAAAIDAMLASGFNQTPRADLYADLGNTYVRLKQLDKAAAAFQQALQIDPNHVSATGGLAELRMEQGQPNEALSLLQKGIALESAAGSRPNEAWFKRALQVAYKAKLPQAVQVSQDWVKAYPTSQNWRDALAIYQNLQTLDDAKTLDLLRLKRVTGALGPGDYFNYADIANRRGLAGEAKAVLEEGFAANAIKRTDPSFRELYSLASQRTKGDRESLPAAPQASANARQTVNIGDAYYGYGDYAKALEFYRAALSKPGADANLINLHIGMALARQGDKAGATAAFGSVGGEYSDLAKYWQLYASSQA